jgi:hypothetical protein
MSECTWTILGVDASAQSRLPRGGPDGRDRRGVIGTFHHISEQHLHRYLAEFDFRYNNRSGLGVEDAERADKIMAGITGKRLTYRRTNEATHA